MIGLHDPPRKRPTITTQDDTATHYLHSPEQTTWDDRTVLFLSLTYSPLHGIYGRDRLGAHALALVRSRSIQARGGRPEPPRS